MSTRSVFGRAQAAAWLPTEAHIARSRLARAMREWGFADLEEFHAASVDRSEWFTRAAAEDLGVPLKGDTTRVRDEGKGRAFPRWFPDARLNVVESCVHRHAADPAQADKPAIVYEGDNGQSRVLTFRELAVEVDRFAATLLRLGVGKGDRVALFMPPVPEAAAAVLGSAKIGATVVPAFSGYGSDALATRLEASGASVLVTVDGTSRRGKPVAMKQIAEEAAQKSPTLRHLVVIRNTGGEVAMREGRDLWWHELPTATAEIELVDPNHPLFIIYTSGTTGAPKGIVHSHIGYLLKSTIDFGYAFDLQADDTLAWIADMGWMLGPLMIIAGLHLGCTIVMIEGLPNFPEPDRMWRIVERRRATMLGVAPTAARGMLAQLDGGRPEADISSLRAFASTGEAWDDPTWRWLFETVGESRLPIINYTGGTETGGGILSCYTIAPIAPASFSGPLPAMDVNVFDADGKATDDIGELVMLNTWAGMAHSFWGDDQRYLDTYWNRWDDVWVHGDLASVDANGFWHIHGRSDDTLKIGGRRVGPAEIESALVAQEGVGEAAVIGVPDPVKGQRVVAFVSPRNATAQLDEEVLTGLAVKALGKGMTPSRIHIVEGLPKTKNGKIMRRAIRARYLGEATGDMSALDPATPLEIIPEMSALAD